MRALHFGFGVEQRSKHEDRNERCDWKHDRPGRRSEPSERERALQPPLPAWLRLRRQQPLQRRGDQLCRVGARLRRLLHQLFDQSAQAIGDRFG